jgi:PilZ domain
MVETRIAPRVRVMKAAKIDCGGDKYPCTVRDISTTRVALDFPDLVRIPDQFTLIMPEDGLKLPRHVVWRREYRVGVVFD